MVYIVIYQQKTFQLQILCLKFVKFYILKNFEHQNVVRIKQKFQQKIYLFLHKQNFFENFSDFFLYNEDKSISLHKKKKMVCHNATFFIIKPKQ